MTPVLVTGARSLELGSSQMNSHPAINYDQCLAAYMENLNTMLRGFRPGKDISFLDTWVPDEDHTASILGIFQAAREAGVPQLTVVVKAQTLAETVLSPLQQALSDMGTLTLKRDGAETCFTLSFGSPAGSDSHDSDEVTHHPVAAPEVLPRTQSASGSVARPSQHDRKQIYQSRIDKLSTQAHYEEALAPHSDFLLATAGHGPTLKLMAWIDRETHIVEKARYAGASTATERALLECLCPLLEGKPVLECSDHAVIELEHTLRDRSVTPPIPGVLMPDNCDEMFIAPLQLVRGLASNYCSLTGYDCIENFYVRPASPRWQKLSEQERQTEIGEALASFKAATMHLLELEGDRRVVVEFPDQANCPKPGHQLMQLERHLQKEVEPILQVHLPAKADLNTIREIKRVQA